MDHLPQNRLTNSASRFFTHTMHSFLCAYPRQRHSIWHPLVDQGCVPNEEYYEHMFPTVLS